MRLLIEKYLFTDMLTLQTWAISKQSFKHDVATAIIL